MAEIQSEPARDVKRALLFGTIASVGAALLFFSIFAELNYFIGLLWCALLEGQLIEFVSGIVLGLVYGLGGLTLGLLVAAPTAFPFILTMTFVETRHPMLHRGWIWGLSGGLFAILPGLWFSSFGPSPDRISGPNIWEPTFLHLYVVCGIIGGFGAWFGYYRPIKSSP